MQPIQQIIKKLTVALDQASSPAEVALLTDKLFAAIEKSEEGSSRLWGLTEASAFLGIRPDTLRKWCYEERVPFIPVGSSKRFDPVRLRKWALSQEKAMNKVWR